MHLHLHGPGGDGLQRRCNLSRVAACFRVKLLARKVGGREEKERNPGLGKYLPLQLLWLEDWTLQAPPGPSTWQRRSCRGAIPAQARGGRKTAQD